MFRSKALMLGASLFLPLAAYALAGSQTDFSGLPAGTVVSFESASGTVLASFTITAGQTLSAPSFTGTLADVVITSPSGTVTTLPATVDAGGYNQDFGNIAVTLKNGQTIDLSAYLHTHSQTLLSGGEQASSQQDTQGEDHAASQSQGHASGQTDQGSSGSNQGSGHPDGSNNPGAGHGGDSGH
jgi:hypothetical protein